MTEATAAPTSTAAPMVVNPGPFTPAQLQILADDQVSRGRITREAADAELLASGITPATRATPEQAATTEALPEPAPADQFDVSPAFDHGSRPDAATVEATGKSITGWLTAAGADKGAGDFLVKETSRLGMLSSNWTPAQDELYAAEERQKAAKQFGAEYPTKLAKARALIFEIEKTRPGLVAMLENTRAGSSAVVIAQFIHLAERRAVRSAAG